MIVEHTSQGVSVSWMFMCATVGCSAAGANLSGAFMLESCLSSVEAHAARMNRADLAFSSLRDAMLEGSDLTNARLEGADVEGAVLTLATGLTPQQLRRVHHGEQAHYDYSTRASTLGVDFTLADNYFQFVPDPCRAKPHVPEISFHFINKTLCMSCLPARPLLLSCGFDR